MNFTATDVSRTVDYSTDKWFMDHVPWASLFCLAGLVVVMHADSREKNGAALAIVYLALMGLAFAGWAATAMFEDRSTLPVYVIFPIGFLIFVAVLFVIAVIASRIGSGPGIPSIGRLRWSDLINPPIHVFGWMLIYLGAGWVAYAILRHYYPARPILRLSPAGIAFHRAWLKDLFISWQDVKAVGPLEIETSSGHALANLNSTAVAVSREFYERHIVPKRNILAPPGFESMFQSKGALVQVVLNQAELVTEPKDFREPVEARWKAFRDQPVSAPTPVGPLDTNIVYGRWSIDGTRWQAVRFIAPLIAIVAVVLHASIFR